MKHDFKMELKMHGGDLPSCTTYTLEDLAPTTTAQQLAEHDDPFIWLTGYTYDNKPYKYAIRRKQ